jgi:conjugal transfer pilus assembly protein TraV
MKKALLIIAGICTMTLSGCASIGQSDFSCKGYSEAGYKCKSAREVYDLTSGHDFHPAAPVADDKHEAVSSDDSVRTAKKRRDGEDVDPPALIQGYAPSRVQMPPLIDGPTPVRTQAKVMRIWINSYEDQMGSLHSPSIVYNEIEERKWHFGNQAIGKSGSTPVRPLQQQQQQ